MNAAVVDNRPQSSSESFREINEWFYGAQPPYSLKDIREFNQLYAHHYRRMDRQERRLIEDGIVEALIKGIERPELKGKIFGVV